MGIKVAPPDINTCDRDFTVDGERVRFGLAGVKGVGDKAVEAIAVARREAKRFTDLYHFCRSVDLHAVNRATIEALIKCGGFDSLGASRAAMCAGLDHAIDLGQSASDDKRTGQMSFFDSGSMAAAAPPVRFPDVEPWSEAQLLAAEKETLGFYITSHPLVRYGRELTSLSTPHGTSLSNLEGMADGTRLTVGCMIAGIRPTVTKTGKSAGKKMAMLTLEDLTGKADAVVFSDAYERLGERIGLEAMVFVAGTVDRRRERPNIIVDEIIPIDQALEQLTSGIGLRLTSALCTGAAGKEFLQRLHDVLVRHRGRSTLMMEVAPLTRPDARAIVRPDAQWFVAPTRKLIDELVGLLGEENLVLEPKPMESGRSRNNNWNGQYRGKSNGNGVASAAVTRFN